MVITTAEIVARFQEWLEEARRAGEPEPTAMSLATTSAGARPNVRIVLLKHADERGFVFYTNLESTKARELEANAWAALCFHWPATKRQVRVEGAVERVAEAEADAYFATRPRLSQIGAWASQQSRPMPDRLALERSCAAVAVKMALGPVPRPPFWSGYRVKPTDVEFWSAKPFRLHDRVRYSRAESADAWRDERLFP